MKSQKIRVAVLMGGPSGEHAISLNTGKMVLKFLNNEKYESSPVVVSKTGTWPITFKELKEQFDVVFIAMHGEYGEDGTVQKLLDRHRIPYTGSGTRASALGMNKVRSFQLFKKKNLYIPPFTVAQKKRIPKTIEKLGYPLVVKPVDRGSSVGISVVHNNNDLAQALTSAFRISKTAIVQKYVSGTEVTCGVIEIKNKPRVLLPTEIIPRRGFFDYHAKYTSSAAREITPARLPEKQLKEIQRIALVAHKAIGASGYSRTDIIVADFPKSKKEQFAVLEINTLPGLTNNSLLPKAARKMDIEFPKLLDIIIEAAL